MSLFGFGIELAGLPGSWPDASVARVRTRIHWTSSSAPVPEDPPWWSMESEDGLLIGWAGEAEYRLQAGSHPRVDVTVGPIGQIEAARLFALSVLPMSLPLFSLEPFHGSAVELPSGDALLVMGNSEAGKSTTSGHLRKAGWRFLADDACALDDDGFLWPGPPVRAARPPSGPDEATGATTFDGKLVEEIEGHDGSPIAVGATIVLDPGPGIDLAIRSVNGDEALKYVLSQVRSPWLMPVRRQARQFGAAMRLASTPVGVVTYEHGRHTPEQVAEAVSGWAGG